MSDGHNNLKVVADVRNQLHKISITTMNNNNNNSSNTVTVAAVVVVSILFLLFYQQNRRFCFQCLHLGWRAVKPQTALPAQ